MIDVSAQVRAYLVSVPQLAALVGSRIYAERDVPPSGYRPSQGGAIVFKVRGGLPDYSESQLNPSLQFKCYGIDEAAAGAVYRALYESLRRKANGYFKSAQVEVLGQTLREPQTEWVYVLAFWRFWMNADAS